MYCKNCGNKLKDNSNFCETCGFKIKELTDINTVINIDNDSLIKLFIGNNYNKIVSLKFSFPTFFFGPLYLLYRKQYLVSLAWTILIILLNVIIPSYAFILLILFSLIFAYFFNEYYLIDVSKRIDDIRKSSTFKNTEELERVVRKKGGTTIVPFVVLLSIFFIFAIMFLYIMIMNYLNSEIQPRNNTVVNDNL
mgnify:CR=1 FL=1